MEIEEEIKFINSLCHGISGAFHVCCQHVACHILMRDIKVRTGGIGTASYVAAAIYAYYRTLWCCGISGELGDENYSGEIAGYIEIDNCSP